MPNVSPLKIAPLWAIPKPLAPAAMVSNAHSATNGLASNPIRKSANNMASPYPVAEDKSESAKPVMANTPNVPVPQAMHGTLRLKNVNTILNLTASLVRCIIATVLAQMTIFPVRNCLVLLFMKNRPARMVG